MKALKLFAAVALATTVACTFVSCQPEEQPKQEQEDPNKEDPNKEDPNKEDPAKKSNEANLVSVAAVINGQDVAATLYKQEKVAEFVYLPEEQEFYEEAILKVTVSAGATTNIAEDKEYNLIEGQKLVITSEDETVKAEWKIEAVPAIVNIKCDAVWNKSAGQIGIKSLGSHACTNGVAFCGPDKLATAALDVIDIASQSVVGKLNTEGLCNTTELYNIHNDDNGILVGAAVINGGTDEYKPSCGQIVAWIDGWDKKPTVLNDNLGEESGNMFAWASCGGDVVNGPFLWTSITAGRNVTTVHHNFSWPSGYQGDYSWVAFNTNYVSNDGCWGQQVSPCTGDRNGWYAIMDSNGSNHGIHVYTRLGYENPDDDNVLYGTVWADGLADAPAEGDELNHEYGNFSYGQVKGFQYGGMNCVATGSTGWPCTYLTIQTVDPNDEEHYILRSQVFDGSAQAKASVSYLYDETTDTGYVVIGSASYASGDAYFIALYAITREIL